MPRAWTLASRPTGVPTDENFALVDLDAPALKDGEVRIANRWLSVDPYMRGRMNDVKSYTPPFQLGAPMEGGAIGEIVESRSAGLEPGDWVQHFAGWRDEAVLPGTQVQPLPDMDAPPQAYLGQLGMPGMTAYFGLLAVGAAKPGETVFVSAAAGAVGSTVVQIAKAKGMMVIGSAGGADKCAAVTALGADAVIDYKAGEPLVKALGRVAQALDKDGGIDVYFDNVGGEHLDAAIAHAKPGGRLAICGMIEMYNTGAPATLRYLPRVIGARLRIEGFIVSDFMGRAAEFHRDMAAMMEAGALRREETVFDGLEQAPAAFRGLFSGENRGKMLVRL